MVHGDGDTKRLSVFDPGTLRRKKVVKLKFRKAFRGASKKKARKIKGVTGIAYDEEHDRFIASVKSTFDYVILSPEFKAVKYIRTRKLSKKLQKQGMDIAGGRIIRIINKYKKKNIKSYLYVYKMSGKLVKRVRLRTGSEVESTYFLNGNMYASTYIEKKHGKKMKRWSHILKIRV